MHERKHATEITKWVVISTIWFLQWYIQWHPLMHKINGVCMCIQNISCMYKFSGVHVTPYFQRRGVYIIPDSPEMQRLFKGGVYKSRLVGIQEVEQRGFLLIAIHCKKVWIVLTLLWLYPRNSWNTIAIHAAKVYLLLCSCGTPCNVI